MAKKGKANGESGRPGGRDILFKCRLCEKEKPLKDMRTVTRFTPTLIVCKDCAKTLN